jgi:hypothetical protein
MGLIPTGKSEDSAGNLVTHFSAERPVRFARIALIIVTFGGFFGFVAGLGTNLGAAFLGLVVFALGVFVWRQTRFGRIMWGLTPGVKLISRTVLVVGTVIAFCTVVGIFVGARAPNAIQRNLNI